MQQPLTFQSAISVFLTYLVLKTAPLSALVYYFHSWEAALIVQLFLFIIILIYSGFNNHHFSLEEKQLIVYPALFFWQAKQAIPYTNIVAVEIKYASEKNNQQWLLVYFKKSPIKGLPTKFRCNWLHMQDPPEIEDDHDHGHPEHELFELLEDEDFYDGSLEQLADELRKKGLKVKAVV